MHIVNLTPHDVNIIGEDGNVVVTFPSTGTVARCVATRQKIGEVNGIPVNRTTFGQVTGLPAPQDGVAYIVSSILCQACPDRTDLYIVDDTVRDENGKIIGARALAYV